MIWYLLYPLRGTTEPPVLAQSHPLRSAFSRYGKYAARHVLTTLLISVAVATILVYPFPFLYTTDFTNGASNLPHHVWTDAQPLGESSVAEPDVMMRSIWVHGSYMQALQREVLLGALELQDQLLGPTVNFSPARPAALIPRDEEEVHGDLSPDLRDSYHVINGLTNSSWFFHSPLLYWACSSTNILNDPDIMTTVNEKKTQKTSVKVILRHSIVFSGKRFRDRRLTAADALVITLIHRRDSPVGHQWVRKAQELAGQVADKWTVIPDDGHSTGSQLYEFQFRPLSLQDKFLLTVAYILTLLYFLLSLSKLRAVKSKFGLTVTVFAQIALSLLSSFTLCAIFRVDLSRIPYFAYPIVVLAISMENSFRLINAVLMTPSDQSPSLRIGYAFGETAHVAVASRVQNLMILWGLSRITYPGVAAFCTFAALAIILDFFYLSTFFLSVLSIEVQRIELSDALSKAASAQPKRQAAKINDNRRRQSWIYALLQGRVALSTRIAGSIIILGFVLIAQRHFFASRRLLSWPFATPSKNVIDVSAGASLLVDVHQARSPTSWLRLQDHETAREVIKVIKPDAHSYVARVYDPLVFVLKGSDRMPPTRERMLLPAVYDFLNHQSLQFIVTLLVILAAVRLLMNYLLWDELAASSEEVDTEDEPALSVRSLIEGHSLDVVMMASANDGRLVTVGLDRMVCMWDLHTDSKTYLPTLSPNLHNSSFPVLAMAIDHDSRILAVLSPSQLSLWDLTADTWVGSKPLESFNERPALLAFASLGGKAERSVVVVRRNGTMLEVNPMSAKTEDRAITICESTITQAQLLAQRATRGRSEFEPSIVAVARNNCVYRVTRNESTWVSEPMSSISAQGQDGVQSILAIAALSVILIVRTRTIDLVDWNTSVKLFTFDTERIQFGSARYAYSAARPSQAGGSIGVTSFTLAYVNADTKECVLQTYHSQEEDGTINVVPLGTESDESGNWQDVVENRRRVPNPGSWELLPAGCVIGIRENGNASREDKTDSVLGTIGLRRRNRGPDATSSKPSPRPHDTFEIWTISQLDKEKEEPLETRQLERDTAESEEKGRLLIAEVGPMVKMGTRSVAVALGNVVKVLTIGAERFGPVLEDDTASENLLNLASRRRRRPGPKGGASGPG